ncbi:hypothetical protein J5N97_021886 [Dioscorea zingiberensis]|uniref:Uncharacterized protein n=1 Tax=Dioscorea zingiberensis TaxID=325984 RepID=A0A9D5C9Z2_9LILI|nr:hypothetical protein J5N97_021886 [Dioscorea zingiberensis]
MASSLMLPFLLPLLLLLSPLADARPCKTLLISSFSYSLPTADHPSLQIRTSSFTVYRVFRADPQPTLSRTISFHRPIFDSPLVSHADVADAGFPFGSLRERARDIMAVVLGLLFGVGCGALTAAIVYLAWTLFTNCCASDDFEEDEVQSPKKMGYVTIPAIEPVPAIKEG